MAPHQMWFNLPVPDRYRPRSTTGPDGSAARGLAGIGLVLAAGLVVAWALIATSGPPEPLPSGEASRADPAGPQVAAEAAFVRAYGSGGFPSVGDRDAVLRVGRAACTQRLVPGRPAGDPHFAVLSPPDARRIVDLAQALLCPVRPTG